MVRAVLTDIGVVADPYAASMLTPSMSAAAWTARHLPGRVVTRSGLLAALAARTLWFDKQVEDALDGGVRQVVTIGAGYDSRAWRLARDGVRFFELDHPATQREKRRRAPAGGPTYVSADLGTSSASSALRDGDWDADVPTLFVMEGLTMYLFANDLLDQLSGLASTSRVGSRLAINFGAPRDSGDSRNRRMQRVLAIGGLGSGERHRLALDASETSSFIESSGWHVVAHLSMRDVALELVPRSSGLPLDAVSPHASLVAAVSVRPRGPRGW
jgi:methyltransferase (TIGR00027 family)